MSNATRVDRKGASTAPDQTNTPQHIGWKKQNAILLSSFMRSGSSVVGDIFNRHPDVFYMFEPLHEIVYKSWKFATEIECPNSIVRTIYSEIFKRWLC